MEMSKKSTSSLDFTLLTVPASWPRSAPPPRPRARPQAMQKRSVLVTHELVACFPLRPVQIGGELREVTGRIPDYLVRVGWSHPPIIPIVGEIPRPNFPRTRHVRSSRDASYGNG